MTSRQRIVATEWDRQGVCVGGGGGVGGERERSCIGFVCMLSAELGQAFVNFAWACLCGNLCIWHSCCTIIVLLYPQIHVNTLAISGHQGSSLSHKHGVRVSASLNPLHTAPLKTGRGHSTCVRSPRSQTRVEGLCKTG